MSANIGGFGGINNNYQPKITDKNVINNKTTVENNVKVNNAPTFNLESNFISKTNTTNAGFEPIALFKNEQPKSTPAKILGSIEADMDRGPKLLMAESLYNKFMSV